MKPTKEQMLERIYEVIADKTLSFGCLLTINRGDSKTQTRFVRDERIWGEWFTITEDWSEIQQNLPLSKMYTTYQIIWHPIMIGDILDWIRVNIKASTEADVYMKWPKYVFEFSDITTMRLLWMWVTARKPIDKQSDECIKFVCDLLPTK